MSDSDFKVITESMVNVSIDTNVSNVKSQRKFPKDLTIGELKGKLELITGASSGTMSISAHDPDNDTKICDLSDNGALLGSYPVDSGMLLRVTDTETKVWDFKNDEDFEKFKLTPEQYENRTDSVRAYLKRNKLGKYNEEEMAALRDQKNAAEKAEKDAADKIKINDRCEVTVLGSLAKRRGTVQFVGKTDFKPGIWVGLRYDEPFGKNDGSVEGKRYFTCPNKYGGFVRPQVVTVGDFPEEELEFSDEDEM